MGFLVFFLFCFLVVAACKLVVSWFLSVELALEFAGTVLSCVAAAGKVLVPGGGSDDFCGFLVPGGGSDHTLNLCQNKNDQEVQGCEFSTSYVSPKRWDYAWYAVCSNGVWYWLGSFTSCWDLFLVSSTALLYLET
uniref:Uncharacterized protein n=1 Tax=Zea mays TaxID=4577 RepID=A0A804P2C1_MAIZE